MFRNKFCFLLSLCKVGWRKHYCIWFVLPTYAEENMVFTFSCHCMVRNMLFLWRHGKESMEFSSSCHTRVKMYCLYILLPTWDKESRQQNVDARRQLSDLSKKIRYSCWIQASAVLGYTFLLPQLHYMDTRRHSFLKWSIGLRDLVDVWRDVMIGAEKGSPNRVGARMLHLYQYFKYYLHRMYIRNTEFDFSSIIYFWVMLTTQAHTRTNHQKQYFFCFKRPPNLEKSQNSISLNQKHYFLYYKLVRES